MSEITQRTEEWFNHRLGKCTASEIHKILGIKGFGETGETYTFEKACEIVFGLPDEDEQIETWDTRRGKELEPLAFSKFKELKEFDFLEVENIGFINYNNYSGASPDGKVSNNSNLEIKCPRRNKFFKLIVKGFDAIDKTYLHQMQFQMMSTKTEKTYFFNYYIDKGFEMWHEIEVYPDDKIIKLIDERLLMFYDKREDYIHQIKKNQQFGL